MKLPRWWPSDKPYIIGDALLGLRSLPDGVVNCVVTSPPYWMLRDYGVKGQLGLEATAEEYLKHMVGLFEEVRRVLRGDGTLWLNLGDGFKDKNLVGVPWRLALALQAEVSPLRHYMAQAKRDA